MTAILAHDMNVPVYYGAEPNISIDLNGHDHDSANYFPTLERPPDLAASGSRSAYRVARRNAWPIRGEYMPAFKEDFYEHIYVNPSRLDLGNLLSDEHRTIFVWNAYTDGSHTIQSINTTGAEGITLSGGIAPPATVRPLTEIEYDLNISMSGPPVIDAVIEFEWDTEAPQLRITGSRVMILTFKPNCDIEETLSWLTDIMSAFDGEQRVALRQAPRQSLELTWTLDRQAFSRMKAQTTGWAHRVYSVPVWTEMSKSATQIQTGDLQVAVDTRNRDYRDGGVIAAIDLRTSAVEALEVDQVFDDHVTLARPSIIDISRAYIAPMRLARALEGFTFTRDGSPYTIARSKLDIADNVDRALDGVELYRGEPVLLDCMVVAEPLTERITRPVEVFDNGSGLIETDVVNGWVRNMQTIAFVKKGVEDIWRLRQWLHARKGRQKAFWLPSWNEDLVVLDTIGAAATIMDVQGIGWPTYYGEKDLMIWLRDGTRLYTHVSNAQAIAGGERLVIDPLGQTVDPENIRLVSIMARMRLDADTITIEHLPADIVRVSVPVVEAR